MDAAGSVSTWGRGPGWLQVNDLGLEGLELSPISRAPQKYRLKETVTTAVGLSLRKQLAEAPSPETIGNTPSPR